MINWKNALGASVLSAGLVFSSFAPAAFAKSAVSLMNGYPSSNGKSLPFLGKHIGSPFDLGLVKEDKVLELLIKQGIISKTATKQQQQKQLQTYLEKRSQKAEQIGTTQQDVKQVRTELQKKEGMPLKDAGTLKAEPSFKSLASVNESTDVGRVQKETWNGPERKDKVLVLLIQYPDFTHNRIDPNNDTPVLFYKNYTQKHYQDMIFGNNGYKGPDGQNLVSVKQYYEQQSGGSYTIDGQVSKWYTASHPAAFYGGNDPEYGSDANPQALMEEALANAAQDPSINLSDYDKQDQFDLDGDGNYNEPDGIIDHLMVIHSGVGEEAGGGSLAEDAIWSHSWNLGDPYSIPGTKLKGYSYTVEPEDGAAGVFAHEFGHDLGLPDEYDTSYSNFGVGAPTGAWTIMSTGSWAGKVAGTEPTGFSPYDKEYLQSTMPELNWFKDIEYNVSDLAEGKTIQLDEASVKGTNADAVKINLPDKHTVVNKPVSGTYEYFGGSANSIDHSMTANVDLTNAAIAKLTFKAWYQIEDYFDYAYVQASSDGGKTWDNLKGNITTEEDPFGSNLGMGITGDSEGWVNASFNLSEYAGKNIELRFRYVGDEGVALAGFYVDNIQVTADNQPVLKDSADDESSSFTLNGFEKNTGTKITSQYYLVEWRNYAGVDQGLEHIAFADQLLGYDPGMIVWYVDNLYTDNNVGDHPGNGFLGVVDAHQETMIWRDSKPNDELPINGVAETAFQIKDAAFSLSKTSNMYLDFNDLFGGYLALDPQPAATVFDDSRDYSDPGQVFAGRNVPKTGLKIHVVNQADDMSVGAIEIHTGEQGSVTMDPLTTNVYSNQEGHNEVTVSGTVHTDGIGESLAVKYELLDAAGNVVTTENSAVSGLNQSFSKTFQLPKDTLTGDYTVKVTVTNDAGKQTVGQASFKVDNEPPVVNVDLDGSSVSSKEAAVTFNLTDDQDISNLEYVWSKHETAPRAGWKPFKNGATLTLSGENGTWYLHVRAKDSLGNAVNWTSKAYSIDNTAPALKLKGANPLTLNQGSKFKEPGFKAADRVDGDLTRAVKVTGNVDGNKAGEYVLTYTVTDKAGNETSITRTVKVVATTPVNTGNHGSKNSSGTSKTGTSHSGNLPDTATNTYNMVISGLIIIAIGVAAFYVQRRKYLAK